MPYMRLPILVMLLLTALQGAGLLHGLHLALEHTQGEHLAHAHHESAAEPAWTSADADTHARPVHNALTCAICQTLTSVRSLAALSINIPAADLLPTFAAATGPVVVVSEDHLAQRAPRGPPVFLLEA